MLRHLFAVAVLALALGVTSPAHAHGDHDDDDDRCQKFDVTFSPQPALPAYDPFNGESMREVTVTVTSKSSGTCDVAIYFRRNELPPVMTRSSSTLQYAIEGPGGNSLVQTSDWPGCVQGNRIDLLDIPKNQTRSVTVRVRVPTGQVRPAGDYIDNYVNLILVNLNSSHQSHGLITEKDFKPNVKIIAKCVLPAPSPVAHDFTPAITKGLPDPALTRISTFNNVQCTAPVGLRLSGSAMQPTSATAPRSGFDNFINWRAQASFGNASAVLSTNTASQVTSPYKNVVSGPTLNASFDVVINLLRGSPVIAGTYSGTLTVAIDPNF